MSGIYYLLSLIAIFVIIFWFVANDRIPSDKPTKGLLAMKFESGAAENKDSGKELRRNETLSSK